MGMMKELKTEVDELIHYHDIVVGNKGEEWVATTADQISPVFLSQTELFVWIRKEFGGLL